MFIIQKHWRWFWHVNFKWNINVCPEDTKQGKGSMTYSNQRPFSCTNARVLSSGAECCTCCLLFKSVKCAQRQCKASAWKSIFSATANMECSCRSVFVVLTCQSIACRKVFPRKEERNVHQFAGADQLFGLISWAPCTKISLKLSRWCWSNLWRIVRNGTWVVQSSRSFESQFSTPLQSDSGGKFEGQLGTFIEMPVKMDWSAEIRAWCRFEMNRWAEVRFWRWQWRRLTIVLGSS